MSAVLAIDAVYPSSLPVVAAQLFSIQMALYVTGHFRMNFQTSSSLSSTSTFYGDSYRNGNSQQYRWIEIFFSSPNMTYSTLSATAPNTEGGSSCTTMTVLDGAWVCRFDQLELYGDVVNFEVNNFKFTGHGWETLHIEVAYVPQYGRRVFYSSYDMPLFVNDVDCDSGCAGRCTPSGDCECFNPGYDPPACNVMSQCLANRTQEVVPFCDGVFLDGYSTTTQFLGPSATQTMAVEWYNALVGNGECAECNAAAKRFVCAILQPACEIDVFFESQYGVVLPCQQDCFNVTALCLGLGVDLPEPIRSLMSTCRELPRGAEYGTPETCVSLDTLPGGPYTGATCTSAYCPNACSGHGACDGATGTCACDAPWGGAACTMQFTPLGGFESAFAKPPTNVGISGAFTGILKSALPLAQRFFGVMNISAAPGPERWLTDANINLPTNVGGIFFNGSTVWVTGPQWRDFQQYENIAPQDLYLAYNKNGAWQTMRDMNIGGRAIRGLIFYGQYMFMWGDFQSVDGSQEGGFIVKYDALNDEWIDMHGELNYYSGRDINEGRRIHSVVQYKNCLIIGGNLNLDIYNTEDLKVYERDSSSSASTYRIRHKNLFMYNIEKDHWSVIEGPIGWISALGINGSMLFVAGTFTTVPGYEFGAGGFAGYDLEEERWEALGMPTSEVSRLWKIVPAGDKLIALDNYLITPRLAIWSEGLWSSIESELLIQGKVYDFALVNTSFIVVVGDFFVPTTGDHNVVGISLITGELVSMGATLTEGPVACIVQSPVDPNLFYFGGTFESTSVYTPMPKTAVWDSRQWVTINNPFNATDNKPAEDADFRCFTQAPDGTMWVGGIFPHGFRGCPTCTNIAQWSPKLGWRPLGNNTAWRGTAGDEVTSIVAYKDLLVIGGNLHPTFCQPNAACSLWIFNTTSQKFNLNANWTFDWGGKVRAMQYLPNSQQIAIVGDFDGYMYQFDLRTMRLSQQFFAGANVDGTSQIALDVTNSSYVVTNKLQNSFGGTIGTSASLRVQSGTMTAAGCDSGIATPSAYDGAVEGSLLAGSDGLFGYKGTVLVAPSPFAGKFYAFMPRVYQDYALTGLWGVFLTGCNSGSGQPLGGGYIGPLDNVTAMASIGSDLYVAIRRGRLNFLESAGYYSEGNYVEGPNHPFDHHDIFELHRWNGAAWSVLLRTDEPIFSIFQLPNRIANLVEANCVLRQPPVMTAGTAQTFFVDLRDYFNRNLNATASVQVTCPGVVLGPITNLRNGTYGFTANTTLAGTYVLNITVNNITIVNSPMVLLVRPAQARPAQTTAAVAGAAFAGAPVTVLVTARDQFLNELTYGGAAVVANVTNTLGQATRCNVTDLGNGKYTVVFTNSTLGVYRVFIGIGGLTPTTLISGAPVVVILYSGVVSGAHSVVNGPALVSMTVGEENAIMVYLFDAYGNVPVNATAPTLTLVNGPLDLLEAPVDWTLVVEGVYTGTFVVVRAAATGNVLTVRAGSTVLAASPYYPSIAPANTTSPSDTIVTFSTALTVPASTTPIEYAIQSRDSYGNNITHGADLFTVTCALITGALFVPVTAPRFIGTGMYRGNFTVTQSGIYTLSVVLLGEQVASSPYTLTVNAAPLISIALSSVTLHPLGLEAGASVEALTVQPRDVFGNLRVSSADVVTAFFASASVPSRNVSVLSATSGYKVFLGATKAEDATISVAVNGIAFSGMPMAVTIVAGPASAATSTAAGQGLVSGVATQPNSFLVEARDAYSNPRGVGGDTVAADIDIGNNKRVQPLLEDFNNGTYELSYTLGDGGSIIVLVSIDGSPIGQPAQVVIEALCFPGSFRQTLIGPCIQCGAGSYAGTVNAAQCTACPPNSGTDATLLGTDIANCTCLAAFYRNGDNCVACPVGGTCAGGASPPVASAGYYPSPTDPTVFLTCDPPEACLGGSQCGAGYSSFKCGTCARGYYLSSKKCIPCEGDSTYLLFLAVLAFILVVGILIWFNFQEHSHRKYAVLAIGFNSLQISALYGDFNIDWPAIAREVFHALSIANFNLEITAPECSIKTDNMYLLKYGVIMALPFILGFMFGLEYAFMHLYYVLVKKFGPGLREKYPNALSPIMDMSFGFSRVKRYKEKARLWFALFLTEVASTPRTMRHTCLRAYYQIIVFCYLPLASMSASYFACQESNGVYTLIASRSTVCFDAAYNQLLAPAIICLIFYCVGIPAAVGYILYKKKKKMTDIKFELRYGFLVSKYKPEFYAWELAVMMRKIVVALCTIFGRGIKAYQALAAILGLFIAHVLQQYKNPYREPGHNSLESISIASAIGVLFLGIFFQQLDLPLAANILIIFVVLGNLAYIGFAFLMEIRMLRRQAKEAAESNSGWTANEIQYADDSMLESRRGASGSEGEGGSFASAIEMLPVSMAVVEDTGAVYGSEYDAIIPSVNHLPGGGGDTVASSGWAGSQAPLISHSVVPYPAASTHGPGLSGFDNYDYANNSMSSAMQGDMASMAPMPMMMPVGGATSNLQTVVMPGGGQGSSGSGHSSYNPNNFSGNNGLQFSHGQLSVATTQNHYASNASGIDLLQTVTPAPMVIGGASKPTPPPPAQPPITDASARRPSAVSVAPPPELSTMIKRLASQDEMPPPLPSAPAPAPAPVVPPPAAAPKPARGVSASAPPPVAPAATAATTEKGVTVAPPAVDAASFKKPARPTFGARPSSSFGGPQAPGAAYDKPAAAPVAPVPAPAPTETPTTTGPPTPSKPAAAAPASLNSAVPPVKPSRRPTVSAFASNSSVAGLDTAPPTAPAPAPAPPAAEATPPTGPPRPTSTSDASTADLQSYRPAVPARRPAKK